MQRWGHFVPVIFGLLAIAGCGGVKPAEPKWAKEKIGDVVKLTGKLTVDGQPPANVTVFALKESDLEQEMKMRSANYRSSLATQAAIKQDGSFSFTTRETGDGLPAGKYLITFKQEVEKGKPNPKAVAFNAKFGDPQKTTYKVTLEKDKPVDMGAVELKN